jgi:hypothetical protein
MKRFIFPMVNRWRAVLRQGGELDDCKSASSLLRRNFESAVIAQNSKRLIFVRLTRYTLEDFVFGHRYRRQQATTKRYGLRQCFRANTSISAGER